MFSYSSPRAPFLRTAVLAAASFFCYHCAAVVFGFMLALQKQERLAKVAEVSGKRTKERERLVCFSGSGSRGGWKSHRATVARVGVRLSFRAKDHAQR